MRGVSKVFVKTAIIERKKICACRRRAERDTDREAATSGYKNEFLCCCYRHLPPSCRRFRSESLASLPNLLSSSSPLMMIVLQNRIQVMPYPLTVSVVLTPLNPFPNPIPKEEDCQWEPGIQIWFLSFCQLNIIFIAHGGLKERRNPRITTLSFMPVTRLDLRLMNSRTLRMPVFSSNEGCHGELGFTSSIMIRVLFPYPT